MNAQKLVFVPLGTARNGYSNLMEPDHDPGKHINAINAYLALANGVSWFALAPGRRTEGGTLIWMFRQVGDVPCPQPSQL